VPTKTYKVKIDAQQLPNNVFVFCSVSAQVVWARRPRCKFPMDWKCCKTRVRWYYEGPVNSQLDPSFGCLVCSQEAILCTATVAYHHRVVVVVVVVVAPDRNIPLWYMDLQNR